MKEMFCSGLFKIYAQAKDVQAGSVTFYFKKQHLHPLCTLKSAEIVDDDVIDCIHSESLPTVDPK
jgi:hypothetical protein